jgi:hypothetical protein
MPRSSATTQHSAHARTGLRYKVWMSPIRGRCLCGAVAFELTPPTDFCSHCHCESCRLAHGAAFVTWTSVPLDRFRFTAGASRVTWYRSSATIEWGFCATCGSSSLYRADTAGHPETPKLDRMYVAVGSLLDPLDREPGAHVSFEERLPWMRAHGLPAYRGKGVEPITD